MQPKSKRQPARVNTTVGDLAAAFYEAALSELKNPLLAARVAEQLVRDAMGRNRLAHI